ncbi:MAG: hypothetical protein BalsKO_27950 [Balneolaceae bacterium]
MAFLIAVLSLGLLGKVLHSIGFWGANFRLIALSEFSVLLFGPTIYLFTRSVLKRVSFSFKDLLHYVPGMSYSAFILFYFIIPTAEVLAERAATGELTRVIYACHAIGLIVNITYWGLALQTLKSFQKEIKNEVSYEPNVRFHINFIAAVGICLLLWLALYITSLSGFEMIERNARPYIWIVLTLLVLFITYYSMVSPKVLRSLPAESRKYSLSKLTEADMEALQSQLEKLMLERKPYLNQKLLKKELAQLLGVNNPELARLLNERIGMNFFEYINYYRIKEFISLTKTEKAKQLTFFGLAQEAGFNSKSTFNKAFKSLMGSSPSDYFRENS